MIHEEELTSSVEATNVHLVRGHTQPATTCSSDGFLVARVRGAAEHDAASNEDEKIADEQRDEGRCGEAQRQRGTGSRGGGIWRGRGSEREDMLLNLFLDVSPPLGASGGQPPLSRRSGR
jgi:hypothetical protein